jgi:hypothetical protein
MVSVMGSDGGQNGGRRVLAGIDEAGFGPLLGPLVIGATAWQVPDDCDGADLWTRLRGGVSKTPSKRFARLAINDSKKIYSPAKGLGDLERGVLGTFLSQSGTRNSDCGIRNAERGIAAGPSIDSSRLPIPNSELQTPNSDGLPLFGRFLDHLAPGWAEQVSEHPWYDGCGQLALPVASDHGDLATRVNGLRVAMHRGGVAFLGAGLELVLEARFNQLCDTIGNKSRMLFCCTAKLIQRLFDRFGRQRLTILCDKQGGRDSYRRLLLEHWPDLHLTVLEEGPARSGYRLAEQGGAGRSMEIRFMPKADVNYLPAALASMYCKYTRELFMRLFNRFWQAQAGQGLQATAGYYTDGQRFVKDVAETARRIGVPPERFIRKR